MNRARRAAALALTVAAALAACAALSNGLERLRRTSLAERSAFSADRLRAAIAADPVDPATTSALGLNRLSAGDGAGAMAAFRIAGRLGWRDLPTQLFWLGVAAQAGDHEVAVDRLDAVLRQNVSLLDQPALLAPLERTAQGRRALAARLAARPPWFGAYWDRTATLAPGGLAARARLLDEPALGAAGMRCEDVLGLARSLADNGSLERSRAIQRRFCGAGSLLVDGGFDRARLDDATSAGWRFTGAGGLDLRFLDGAPVGSRSLSVASVMQ